MAFAFGIKFQSQTSLMGRPRKTSQLGTPLQAIVRVKTCKTCCLMGLVMPNQCHPQSRLTSAEKLRQGFAWSIYFSRVLIFFTELGTVIITFKPRSDKCFTLVRLKSSVCNSRSAISTAPAVLGQSLTAGGCQLRVALQSIALPQKLCQLHSLETSKPRRGADR